MCNLTGLTTQLCLMFTAPKPQHQTDITEKKAPKAKKAKLDQSVSSEQVLLKISSMMNLHENKTNCMDVIMFF